MFRYKKLASGDLLIDAAFWSDDGDFRVEGELWWFPDYMLDSPSTELKNKGRVIFRKAR